MTSTVVLRRMLFAAALSFGLPAAAQQAGAPEALVAPIQVRWAEIKYQQRNRSVSGVLLPPAVTRNNPPHVQSGGAQGDQGESTQQQVAAA